MSKVEIFATLFWGLLWIFMAGLTLWYVFTDGNWMGSLTIFVLLGINFSIAGLVWRFDQRTLAEEETKRRVLQKEKLPWLN